MDDSEITAAIAAADPAGLLTAYDRYAANLYGYCCRILGEPAPAGVALVRTFEAAAAELSDLTDAGEVRAWLYAAARAECHRAARTTAASAGSQAVEAARAAVAGFESQEQEAIELSVRHGLSEAELAAVLGMSGQEAHAASARTRDNDEMPGLSPLDAPPAELREQLRLLVAAVSTASPSGEGMVRRARSAGGAGFRRLGELVGWSRIRANLRSATVVAAVAAWAVAAIGATLITVTGAHGAHAAANQSHTPKPAAATPGAGGTVSPSIMASPSQPSRPASSPARAGVAPPTTGNPSPTQRTGPSPSPSPSARPSPSPSPSPSSSPSPSTPSPSPSSSPSSS